MKNYIQVGYEGKKDNRGGSEIRIKVVASVRMICFVQNVKV